MSQDESNSVSQFAGVLPGLTASAKKPYKVVLESVTKEKKKLRSTVSYDLHAPQGYTFVPVGAPDLTEYCKELSRKRGLRVFIVSVEPKNKAHKNPKNISHHIHRTGHHFRNDVVDVACELLGYTSRGSNYVRNSAQRTAGPLALARRLDSHGEKLGASGREDSPERERKKVAGAIRDLFPKIPSEDQEAIVTRAFEEGTARVGNADLPLARRVQLAVVAHIRHTKTDYDNLLKATNWQTARQRVEQACLEQIVKWRGEDEAGEEELEDMFQEVIVLDDESDAASSHSRDSSVEIVLAQPVVANLDKNSHHQGENWHTRNSQLFHSRDEPEIIHVQPRRAVIPLPVLQQKFRQRWNEARARVGFRTNADNGSYVVNEPLARKVRTSDAAEESGGYATYPSQQPRFQSLYQVLTTRPRSAQKGISNVDIHDSVEAYRREQTHDQSRPLLALQRVNYPASFNQNARMLCDKPMKSREVDTNRPFYVPQGQEIRSEYASRPPHDANVALHGIKRKSMTDITDPLNQSDQIYTQSPAKRTRLIGQHDGDDEASLRLGRDTWSHAVYSLPARRPENLPYELVKINSLGGDSDRYERYVAQDTRRIQPQEPREVAYLQREKTDGSPGRVYVSNDRGVRTLGAVDRNMEHLRLVERPQRPLRNPNFGRSLHQQRPVAGSPPMNEVPLEYRPREIQSSYLNGFSDRHATYDYRTAPTGGRAEHQPVVLRPPIQLQRPDPQAGSPSGAYLRPRQTVDAAQRVTHRYPQDPGPAPQGSPSRLPSSQTGAPGRTSDGFDRSLHVRRR